MYFRALSIVAAVAVCAFAGAVPKPEETVLTAQHIYHTVIDVSPFLLDKTTTIVWTQTAEAAAPTAQ